MHRRSWARRRRRSSFADMTPYLAFNCYLTISSACLCGACCPRERAAAVAVAAAALFSRAARPQLAPLCCRRASRLRLRFERIYLNLYHSRNKHSAFRALGISLCSSCAALRSALDRPSSQDARPLERAPCRRRRRRGVCERERAKALKLPHLPLRKQTLSGRSRAVRSHQHALFL